MPAQNDLAPVHRPSRLGSVLAPHSSDGRLLEIFLTFLRLGLSSFGGPIAHLGYFRQALVLRRRWLDDISYADLVALCQFLPGPASSQVSIGIGLARAGIGGALAAWLGFTLPSAVMMAAVGLGVVALGQGLPQGAVHGLEVAVVAVVAQALLGMSKTLCPDAARRLLALFAAGFLLLQPSPWGQLAVLAAGALAGLLLRPSGTPTAPSLLHIPVRRRTALAALLLLMALLILLPLAADRSGSEGLALANIFLRTGSLVFGGGHVVLPLLQAELVPSGIVEGREFLAGYGVVQIMPGPLFTFAAYLGAVAGSGPGGWSGAGLCVVAIFLPSFLLVIGTLPFWVVLRTSVVLRRGLMGVNAAVVGLLLAAFIDPVCKGGLLSLVDLALALVALLLLFRQIPPWAVVVGVAAAGWGLAGVSAA